MVAKLQARLAHWDVNTTQIGDILVEMVSNDMLNIITCYYCSTVVNSPEIWQHFLSELIAGFLWREHKGNFQLLISTVVWILNIKALLIRELVLHSCQLLKISRVTRPRDKLYIVTKETKSCNYYYLKVWQLTTDQWCFWSCQLNFNDVELCSKYLHLYSACILQFSYMMMFEPYFKSRKRGNEVWHTLYM